MNASLFGSISTLADTSERQRSAFDAASTTSTANVDALLAALAPQVSESDFNSIITAVDTVADRVGPVPLDLAGEVE